MFVQPLFFFAAAALGIPLIVHLIFRRRTKEVTLGSLRFLKIVLQENARKKRVMRWLLLALRLACVALLAFLFARPYLLAEGEGEKENAIAILIDQSASMMLKDNSRRLVDQAVADAKKIVAERGSDARVEIAFFDSKVSSVGVDELSRLSEDTTYGATNFGAALAWARDVLGKQSIGEKDLHLFSDLQRSGLDWSEVDPLPAEIRVHIHQLGLELPNNVAVTNVTCARNHLRPGETTTVTATIFNAAPFPLDELPVEMKLKQGNKVLSVGRHKVRLEPEAVETVEFEIPALDEGLWEGTVAVETRDDLPFDNQRHVAILAAQPYAVLILDGDPRDAAVMSESYYLSTALRLAPQGQTYVSPYMPTVMKYTGRVRLPKLDNYAVVILANVSDVRESDTKTLADYVAAGGGLVVFTGANVQPGSYSAIAQAGLGPGEIAAVQLTNDLPWRLRDWKTKHAIFAPFADPQHGDLRRLAFGGYTQIAPREDADVLVSFDDGSPALIEVAHGKGQALWFASSCDRHWSDWSRGRLFLPLAHQMLGYLTGLTDGGPVRNELLDGTQESSTRQTPGVYQREKYWQVLNVVPRESETDRCSAEDFVSRFGISLVEQEDGLPQVKVQRDKPELTDALRDNEQWHWLVLVLMGVLSAEFFVANRTTV